MPSLLVTYGVVAHVYIAITVSVVAIVLDCVYMQQAAPKGHIFSLGLIALATYLFFSQEELDVGFLLTASALFTALITVAIVAKSVMHDHAEGRQAAVIFGALLFYIGVFTTVGVRGSGGLAVANSIFLSLVFGAASVLFMPGAVSASNEAKLEKQELEEEAGRRKVERRAWEQKLEQRRVQEQIRKREAREQRAADRLKKEEVAERRASTRSHAELVARQRGTLVRLYRLTAGISDKEISLLELARGFVADTLVDVKALETLGYVNRSRDYTDGWDDQISLTRQGASAATVRAAINIERITMNGDRIVTGDNSQVTNRSENSTTISRSSLNNSINKVEGRGEEVAAALRELAATIESSDSPEAAELFDAFNEELTKSEPKKSVLKSLYSGMIDAVPVVGQMADVATKLAPLFQ